MARRSCFRSGIWAEKARRRGASSAHVADVIRTAVPVKHLNETGLRIAARTRWLHVLCTPFLTVLRIGAGRGDVSETFKLSGDPLFVDKVRDKERIEGLSDEPRPGRPRTLTDEQVAEVIERTLETTPADATHWSIRSMARESGLSHTIRPFFIAQNQDRHRPANATGHRKDLQNPTPMVSILCYQLQFQVTRAT